MTINRSLINKQLIPGLNKVFGMNYKSIDNEHKVLFEIENSTRSFEEEVMMTGFEIAPVKAEGAAVTYDDAMETYNVIFQHETIALAFSITEEAVEDRLYMRESLRNAKALGRAMAETKQTKAANIFNNGFSDNGGDGVPLFSASHPTRSAGNLSNTVSSDLSETALQTAVINIGLYKDERGLLINAKPMSLHIPRALMFDAQVILNSDLSTTVYTDDTAYATNVNDKNVLKGGGFFPRGVHINHRFTDTNAWFIKTDVPNSTKMFVRKGIQYKTDGDFDTGNFKYMARERYSFGHAEWRGWYGSNGSS